jgi:NitT/TauT family transport system permease protein
MSGSLWAHLIVTLQESLLGLAIGATLGVTTGFALARSPFAARVLEPYITMLNAVPRVVLAPLFLLWFGLPIWSKVALAVTLVFFVMFFNTYQGVRDADRVIIANVRMLGATERQLVRHVLIPSALSWIFSSLQTSLGFALVGAVVGEYLGATRGLGYVISQAEGTFDTTGVFAGMAILSSVVVVVSAGVSKIERWLLRWKNLRRRNLPAVLLALTVAAGVAVPSSGCGGTGGASGRVRIRANRDSAARLAHAIVRTLNWMHAHSEEEIAARTPKACAAKTTRYTRRRSGARCRCSRSMGGRTLTAQPPSGISSPGRWKKSGPQPLISLRPTRTISSPNAEAAPTSSARPGRAGTVRARMLHWNRLRKRGDTDAPPLFHAARVPGVNRCICSAAVRRGCRRRIAEVHRRCHQRRRPADEAGRHEPRHRRRKMVVRI